MKKISLLVLAIFMFFTITSCGSNSNTDSNKTNPSTTDNQSGNTQDNDNCYLYEKNLNSAIKQEQNGNNISLAVENNKETIRVDELFSYSSEHLIEIYSSSNSAYNTTTKEMTLTVGFNNYQILFKNLKNYNEITYDLKIFRDPGIVTKKVTQYSMRKEVTESKQENGLPTFNLKFYYPGVPHLIYDGIEMPTIINECNIDMHFYTVIYVTDSSYPPTSDTVFHFSKQFTLEHTFTSISEVYEVAVDFPIELWNEFHSTYPFTTIETTQQGIYNGASSGITVFSSSYINMEVDYSKFKFN